MRAPASARWTSLTLIATGAASVAATLPLRHAARLGLVPAIGYTPLQWACLIAGIGLAAMGLLIAALSRPPRATRPEPGPPMPDAMAIGWAPETGWIRLQADAQQRHTLILGSSGSGKTQLLLSLLAQQAARGGGALMLDAKVDRSALNAVLAICERTNRLHDLKLIWPPDPAVSHTWNPLLRGSLEEVMARIMALWGTDLRGEAEFWRGSAHNIISVVLMAMRRINPAITFTDLYLALTSVEILLWLETQVPAGTDEADALSAFLSNYRTHQGKLNIEHLKRMTGGAPQYIYPFAWGSLGDIMRATAPGLDLLTAITQGHIVYVALPILARTEEAVAMARMLVADLKQAVGAVQQRPEKPEPPFLVLLDEASAYSNVQGIERLFEQARSANVALVAASQVLSGFAIPNKATLDFVLGNTGTKVVMSLGDFKSAETMAQTIGEERRLFLAESSMQDRTTSAPWFSPIPTRAGRGARQSLGGQERYDYSVRPERLLSQPTGRAVVVTKDPKRGARLTPEVRTCLTQLPTQVDVELPPIPRVGPAGLDLLGLIRRELATDATAQAPAAAPAAATGTTPRRRRSRRVRRTETEEFVILEPTSTEPKEP
jgi:intracellular multiplication protein IcmO